MELLKIIEITQNQVENFLPYLTGKKQLTPRARDLTFCNWATNKVVVLNPDIFKLKNIGINYLQNIQIFGIQELNVTYG